MDMEDGLSGILNKGFIVTVLFNSTNRHDC